MSKLESSCSVKSMSVQNSFCSLQLLPKHVVQTNRNKANCVKSSLLFLCAITHIFWYWKELSQVTIRVNRFEISFSSGILHHTYSMFYRMLLINVSERGNTSSFSFFLVQRTGWIRNMWCYFPWFGVSIYTLYTIKLKWLLGGVYRELSNFLPRNH